MSLLNKEEKKTTQNETCIESKNKTKNELRTFYLTCVNVQKPDVCPTDVIEFTLHYD